MIGAGTYTSITSIDAPTEARAGTTVTVRATIQNIYSYGFYVTCIGVLDSTTRFIDWVEAYLGVGKSHTFTGTFTMPAYNVTVNIYSYYKDAQGYTRSDDSKSKTVKVQAAYAYWTKLDTETFALIPEEVSPMWKKLHSTTFQLVPEEVGAVWRKLHSTTFTLVPEEVSPPQEGWAKLDTKTIKLEGEEENWKKWIPWIAGAGAVGLAIYAITRRD